MVLNISPKRRADSEETPPVADVAPAAEPATPAEEPKKRTRRTTATSRATGGDTAAAAAAAPARTTRTRRTAAQKAADAAAADAPAADAPAAEAPISINEIPSPASLVEDEAPMAAVEAPADSEASEDADGNRPTRSRSRSRGGRGRGRGGRTGDRDDRGHPDHPADLDSESPAPADLGIIQDDPNVAPELRPILRALEQQARQVERLARVTEDLARRSDRPASAGGSNGASPRVARVGVFVDTANIELATDRLRVRFDWSKVMRLLLKDRQLVRAVAYSPIHDDPAVSIETQRFVEPFLDRGFKIVTKAFRRFQDGSIKANLDIELALDVVSMLDRLDVLILVSGDGDFQRLVELAQSRGVRVEVAAVGASTAGNLRHAADEYIDLGSRARDLRA